MTLDNTLREALGQALAHCFDLTAPADAILLQPTKKEFAGSHTFVTFPYAKSLRQAPAAVAQALGEWLQSQGAVAGFNVVQGFLNLTVADRTWLDTFVAAYTDAAYGTFPTNGQRVMVEFSSPNTNKPLHLGHLRNNFLGYAVAEILRANGYAVIKANIANDRGIHICKSMLMYQRLGNGQTPDGSHTKGDHLVGHYYVEFDRAYRLEIGKLMAGGMGEDEAKKQAPLMRAAQQMLLQWEQGDPATVALWQQMNGWVYAGFAETYRAIGVDFDASYFESTTYHLGKDVVNEGLQKGVFFRKVDGSVWCDLTADGLDEKLVLRADGTSVYVTQDLGTADMKFADYAPNKSIYVVGNEQDYHFAVLFAILKRLGRPYADGLYHLSYGMVDLPTGRMKTREGTVVDADDLIDEMIATAETRTKELGKIEDFGEQAARELYRAVGLGALKYYLLKVEPRKRMLFNPEESVDFEGHTGSFVQYTHARASSVLRKAASLDVPTDAATFAHLTALHSTESDLINWLTQYPARVQEAGAGYAPSVVAQYVYDLAKVFNRFFAEVSILAAPDPASRALRVALTAHTARTLRLATALLGMEMPERM